MASAKILNLTDADFDGAIADGVTLVDFWAPWCGPCRMLSPLVDKVADRVSDKAKVAKVNTDDASSVAVKYGITSIPTLIIFKNGQEVERLRGAQQREEDLVNRILGQL